MARPIQELVDEHARGGGVYGGWITGPDKEWLVAFLQDAFPPSSSPLFVEIGVFLGGESNVMLLCCPGARLIAIDDWSADPSNPKIPSLRQGFIDNTSGAGFYPNRIEIVDGMSQDIGRSWNRRYDLLYLDGDHAYGPARADLDLFLPWCWPGGYVLVDDYDMPEVRRAVEDTIGAAPGAWEVVRAPDGTPAKLYCARRPTCNDGGCDDA
jgi:hypothetical protein